MYKYLIGLVAVLLLIGGYVLLPSEPSRPQNPVIQGINYVGISVSSLEHSSELYSKAFGLAAVQTSGQIDNAPLLELLSGREGVQVASRLLRSSNSQLRLLEFQQTSDAVKHTPQVEVNGPGIAHVCVQVNQTTQAYQTFLAGGATAVGAEEMVQLNPSNPVYYAYARDEDNIMFEVEHVDIEALDLDTPPKNNYRIRHVALASPDFDSSVGFYSILFEQENPRRLGRLFAMRGEKFDKVSGLPDTKLKMAFFQVRNMELEIAQYVSHPTELPETPRPLEAYGYNMIVFDVKDLNMAKDLLLKAGGAIVSEPQPLDGGQIMFARDLDGNLLGFQVLDESSPFSAKQFKDNGI